MKKTSKRERLEKVASTRVHNILDMLTLLQNCANTNNYEYTDDDVELMFGEIGKALRDARAAYSNAKNKEEKKCFSFDRK